MKRKILKGFTLVELIIVMALMTILMAAIMQLFRPIRETFVDSTAYESQRTVQNGMVKYVTESVKFSTDLGIYSHAGTINSASKAVDAFAAKYVAQNPSASAADVKKNAEVIIIDREHSYSYGSAYSSGTSHTGRLIRRKLGSATVASDPGDDFTSNSDWRLALGSAYYGTTDYTISLDVPTAASDGIGVTVASAANVSMRSVKADGSKSNAVTVSNTGLALCRNLFTSAVGNNPNAGVNVAGVYDVDDYDSTATTKNVYIVFLNEKV